MVENAVMKKGNGDLASKAETATEQIRTVRPAVDIYDEGDKVVLIADIPGVTNENLKVNIEDRYLTIDATAHVGEERNAVYSEYELTNYHRQFELSDQVNPDNISADLKHGVLTLHMHKAEKAKPRSIEVKVA